MDWLKGMNDVIEHIEDSLTEPIVYESLSRIVGCSAYEFSRIFSFMAGISISEYIRRRRLSQAVFDIQGSDDKIIDVALKYCYESPATFTRAFRELHGVTPSSARKEGTTLKTYPPISFALTIKGVDKMDFRIEKKESFKIAGLTGYLSGEPVDGLPPAMKDFFDDCEPVIKENNKTPIEHIFVMGDPVNDDGEIKAFVGAPVSGGDTDDLGLDLRDVCGGSWVVFADMEGCINNVYTRIYTEWFPSSGYQRNESMPSIEVFALNDDGRLDEHSELEVWVPIL